MPYPAVSVAPELDNSGDGGCSKRADNLMGKTVESAPVQINQWENEERLRAGGGGRVGQR